MSKPANEPNLDDLQDKVMEHEIGKERQQKKIKRIDNGNKPVRKQFDQSRNEKLKSISGVKPSKRSLAKFFQVRLSAFCIALCTSTGRCNLSIPRPFCTKAFT